MKKILIVDDSHFFRTQMQTSLLGAGYKVVTACDGEEGLMMVKKEKPDLVLLDGVMPKLNGLDVCRILRESESNNLMPIIMLTSLDQQEYRLEGLELGADDYIIKPFNERELLSRIRNTLRRIERNRSASPLTGLSGNIEISRELERRIAEKEPYAVVYIDLDNFKAYNDVYGFAKGDAVIKLTADILTGHIAECGNQEDFVGHIGGDDFVFVTTPDLVDKLCTGIIAEFDERIRGMYTEEDLERGGITVENRRGQVEDFPLVSLSMAVVTNQKREFENHLEIAEVASELKSAVKAVSGSCYKIDRRGKDERKKAQ